jgi:hypothetical protein
METALTVSMAIEAARYRVIACILKRVVKIPYFTEFPIFRDRRIALSESIIIGSPSTGLDEKTKPGYRTLLQSG